MSKSIIGPLQMMQAPAMAGSRPPTLPKAFRSGVHFFRFRPSGAESFATDVYLLEDS